MDIHQDKRMMARLVHEAEEVGRDNSTITICCASCNVDSLKNASPEIGKAILANVNMKMVMRCRKEGLSWLSLWTNNNDLRKPTN